MYINILALHVQLTQNNLFVNTKFKYNAKLLVKFPTLPNKYTVNLWLQVTYIFKLYTSQVTTNTFL